MKITLHQHARRNERVWVVGRFVSGRRVRSSFHSKSDAENFITKLIRGDVPEPTRVESAKTLGTAISDLVRDKQSAGKSPDYTSNLSCLLGQFARGREALRLRDVRFEDVRDWLGSHPIASRSTLRARLSTLFKYCVRHGWIESNPCERLEAVSYVKPRPKVFTPSEAKKSLLWLSRHKEAALPWFVLSTWCGLRPEEAEQVRRSHISFKEGYVRVEFSKVRQRRVVYPRESAMVLLKWAVRRGRLPLGWQTRRRALRGLREHLGWKEWPKDVTRHSAASYWLAVEESAARVALALGNSEKVLLRDYRALVTKSEAERFWSIKPPSMRKKYSEKTCVDNDKRLS